jgi:hypothetical protein
VVLEAIIYNHIASIIYKLLTFKVGEPGSSVSIVSGYGLDERAIEVRSPAGAQDFSSILCV